MTQAQLIAACRSIKSYDLSREIEDLIRSAEENANDTVYVDREATEEAWEQVFHDTLQCLLTERGVSKNVIAWFGRRGVRG